MQFSTIQEVQAKLPELLRQLSESQALTIVDDGKPVGRLLPPTPKGRPMRGRGKGKLTINSEDDEILEDFTEYRP